MQDQTYRGYPARGTQNGVPFYVSNGDVCPVNRNAWHAVFFWVDPHGYTCYSNSEYNAMHAVEDRYACLHPNMFNVYSTYGTGDGVFGLW